jgi:hypothetical protein
MNLRSARSKLPRMSCGMLFAFYVCTKTGDCIAMAPNTHGAEQGTAFASGAIGKSQEANAFITGGAMTACAHLAIFAPCMTAGVIWRVSACDNLHHT